MKARGFNPRRGAPVLGALAATLLLSLGSAAAASHGPTATVAGGTLTVEGTSADETIALRLASPTTLVVDVGADGTADFSFDRSTFMAVVVNGAAGDDTLQIDQSGGTFTDEAVTLDGGKGADTLLGASGADTLLGGDGDDFADGNQGVDTAALGSDDDRFQWDPGDGSDVVDGDEGTDLLDFNGANIAEHIGVSANGERVRFTRDIASITMDLGGVERVGFHARGGADTIVVDDLAGTDARTAEIDLGGADGAADTVVARGTDGPDTADVSSDDATVLVSGLGAQLQVTGGEALDSVGPATLGGPDTITTGVGLVQGDATIDVDGGDDADVLRYSGTAGDDTIDVVANGTEATVVAATTSRVDALVESLVVQGFDGNDTITGTGNLASLTTLTEDGGDGNDTLRGGNGADLLLGGRGDDFADGNQGADQALLGRGNDVFQWDPGDGSDTVDGETGADSLAFNGSNIAEQIGVSANGSRVRFTRDIAAITMDLGGVEHLGFVARAGADRVTVDPLTGTDAETVDVDLGGPDTAADTVVARGTDGADSASVSSDGATVVVSGLGGELRVTGGEPLDSIGPATLGGADTVTTGIGVAGPAVVAIDGGDDSDVVQYRGTAGDDTIGVVANGTAAAVDEASSALVNSTAVESLVVSGFGGNDTITGVGNLAPLTTLTEDGGAGDDTLRGGNGADVLLGGAGDDFVDGNQGSDQAFLGKGNDRFEWDPGDGSDVVEGEGGSDVLDFFGSNIAEKIEISANGERGSLTRDIAAITMDFDGIEDVVVRTSGGTDTLTVDDLSGTAVKTVDADIASATPGTPDGAADAVVVNGTDRRDRVDVTNAGGTAVVEGLAATVLVAGADPTLDTLTIKTLAGDDDVTVASDVADLLSVVVDLGADD
jgi:Ca2+-binding RTX toxin-like protein